MNGTTKKGSPADLACFSILAIISLHSSSENCAALSLAPSMCVTSSSKCVNCEEGERGERHAYTCLKNYHDVLVALHELEKSWGVELLKVCL